MSKPMHKIVAEVQPETYSRIRLLSEMTGNSVSNLVRLLANPDIQSAVIAVAGTHWSKAEIEARKRKDDEIRARIKARL